LKHFLRIPHIDGALHHRSREENVYFILNLLRNIEKQERMVMQCVAILPEQEVIAVQLQLIHVRTGGLQGKSPRLEIERGELLFFDEEIVEGSTEFMSITVFPPDAFAVIAPSAKLFAIYIERIPVAAFDTLQT
jgi:hypothetical protein